MGRAPAGKVAVAVAVFGALAPLLVAISPSSGAALDEPTVIAAALLTVAILAAAFVIGRFPAMRRAWAGPALAYLVVVVLLRDATGGTRSVIGLAVALPVLWLALYGGPRELAAAVAGVAVVFGGPLLLVGGPDYPLEAWPRTVVSVLIVSALGWTVRHHARALAEREALTRSIVQSAQDTFVSWNEAGVITGWNRQAEVLFGYSEAEALGRSVIETLVPPRFRDGARRDVERFLAVEAPHRIGRRGELFVLRRDGAELTVEMATSAVATARGYVFNAFLHDISERHRAEQRLRDTVRTLEAIAEATHALSRSTDPSDARTAICEAAREVAGAPLALLIEPRYIDGFVVTASSGIDPPADGWQIPELSKTAEDYLSGTPFFVSDAATSERVSKRLVELAGIGSLLFHPVHHAGETIGLLAVAWREPLSEPPPSVSAAMTLLAMHAAAAIDRSNMLLRLDALARTDALTGLPNRRAWDESLPRELERARRDERPLSIGMLDMDHFSAYNAAHGHPGGDRLLKASGSAWRSMLRGVDMLARCGGEEFGVILPAAGMEEALSVIERVREATPDGETCSAGVAIWDGEESAAELVARADEALYAAKVAGRDRTLTATGSG